MHGLARTKEEREAKVGEAMERAGLTPPALFLDRYPHELSGGQRQRVAIAAALVLEPKLLIADEPVSMLDVSVRAGILGLLDGLRRDGMGVLMITHDLSTAAHFADRIAVMYLGRIVEEGPARDVVRDPQHPYTKALISVVPLATPTPCDAADPHGRDAEPGQRAAGCRFHPRCPVAEARCKRDRSAAARRRGRGAGAPRRVHPRLRRESDAGSTQDSFCRVTVRRTARDDRSQRRSRRKPQPAPRPRGRRRRGMRRHRS